MKQLQRIYDKQRKKYFMDAVPPLRVPPPASELLWNWLPDNSPNLAETIFDEDGDPQEIRISPVVSYLRQARTTIQHELIHIRLGPKLNCDSNGRLPAKWRAEILRLAQLGAIKL